MAKSRSSKEVFESYKPGHFGFDARAQACELLALFMADKPVHQLMAKHYFEGLVLNYTDYREERVMKLLIEIATTYRINSWSLGAKERKKEEEKWVGMIFDEHGEGVRMSMHEACNKVIHADEISFSTRTLPNKDFAYIKDDIMISGRRGKAEWLVGIWIVEFCDAALTMTMVGEDLDV